MRHRRRRASTIVALLVAAVAVWAAGQLDQQCGMEATVTRLLAVQP
jgi:hypothetical protein